MKAKDYFEKYRKLLYEVEDGIRMTLKNGTEVSLPKTKDGLTDVISALADEFFKDFDSIREKRRIRAPSAWKGLIEEFNDKWNAVTELFTREYGDHVLRRNGFRALIIHRVPILKALYEVEKENETLEQQQAKGD